MVCLVCEHGDDGPRSFDPRSRPDLRAMRRSRREGRAEDAASVNPAGVRSVFVEDRGEALGGRSLRVRSDVRVGREQDLDRVPEPSGDDLRSLPGFEGEGRRSVSDPVRRRRPRSDRTADQRIRENLGKAWSTPRNPQQCRLAVTFRRINEGDREGRQPKCGPHRVCALPKHVLCRGLSCHIASRIERQLDADGPRIAASKNGLRLLLSQPLGQGLDPLIAQRAVVVPRPLEPNSPFADHPLLIVVPAGRSSSSRSEPESPEASTRNRRKEPTRVDSSLRCTRTHRCAWALPHPGPVRP
jgi:hypothetical protein